MSRRLLLRGAPATITLRRFRSIAVGLLLAIMVLVAMDAVTFHLASRAAAAFDQNIRSSVHSAASPFLTVFFEFETWLGSRWVLIPVCVVVSIWLLRRGKRAAALLLLAAFGGADGLMEVTKAIVRRARPIPYYQAPLNTWSFPSGHSFDSAAVYWTIAAVIATGPSFAGRRAAVCAMALLPLITGFSRVYLGVHYPTDVVTGWVAGACWSAGIARALRVE